MSRAYRSILLLGLSISVAPALAAGTGTRPDKAAKKRSPESPALRLAQAAAPAHAPAPVAIPEAPRFDIERFDVQGNTLLDAEAVASAVGRFTGKRKDFADVQRALEALQQKYQELGYGMVQVTLPEQELDQGVITLRILEPKLGRVVIEGNKFFDEANIRRSIPALKEGETPNIGGIARSSRLANENAAKRTTVLLRAGENESTVDATVRVQDEKFWRASVSLDNTGSSTTGMWRLGAGFQHSNLFNRDHTLTVQYQLDPEPIDQFDDLKILGIGYRIPFYDLDGSLDLLAGYSSIGSASGQVISGVPFNISGSGTIVGARWNHQLPRVPGWNDYEHRLSFGLDYKAFSNHRLGFVQNGVVQPVQPDVTVHPWSVTYSGSRTMDRAQMGFYGTFLHNFYPHGNDAGAEKFNGPVGIGARPGVGRAGYTVWRAGMNFIQGFANDVQWRAVVAGQWTRDALIPGEQFGLGGWESVRGMREREASNDRGLRTSIEIYSPDLSSAMSIPNGRLRLLAFYDWGYLSQNFKDATVCAPAACRFSASSVGFGMRLSLQQGFSMRVDYARMHDPAIVGNRGDSRLHFGMAFAF
jgi:hemolysin activation/secretion protein